MSGFAERTTGVHGFERGSGRTVSHDKDIYKYVIWEWLDSLGEVWHSIDRQAGLEIFSLHTGECIALSALDVDVDVRDAIDAILRAVPGYVGAFAIDPGNPVHRGGFFDNLIYAAAIEVGTIVQELSYEGEQDWPLEGSATFKPDGPVWQPYGWLESSGPNGLQRGSVSKRGKKAAEGIARKQAGNVEQRVLEEMSRAFFLNAGRKTFEFKAVAESSDILQAIMPEPPILPPGVRGDAEWSQLWAWANAEGVRAGESHVPTPMFLSGIGAIPEGECGTALVRVFDARRGFARWLKREGLGDTDGYGGVVTFSPIPSQSIDRANAWARTVASILRLNGIEADVQSFDN